MKNLKLTKRTETSFSSITNPVLDFCIDINNDAIYVLFTDGTTSKAELFSSDPLLDNFYCTENPLRIIFLTITREVCVVDTQKIAFFDQDCSLFASTAFSDGCSVVEFSPGQDSFAIVTDNGWVQVYAVTSNEDISLTNQIKLDDYKDVNQFINVGWGSKETQFHGSEGKDARSKKVIEDVSSSCEIRKGESVISWRGDGALFAVNFLRGDNYAFLVLTNEGVPQFKSDVCPGLESPLCWKPSGNLIAGVQHLPNKYQVVFFEKNGLRHGEFAISKKAKVKKLQWSIDSEILSINYSDNRVELWMSSNYHWYLKQSLNFGAHFSTASLNTFWDTTNMVRNGIFLHVLCYSEYVKYEWVWEVSSSKALTKNNLASVAVIDGNEVRLSSFKKASIPPPMCNLKLSHEQCVNFVIFGSVENPNDICTIQDDYTSIIYKCTDEDKLAYEIKRRFNLLTITDVGNNSKIPLSHSHVLWINPHMFLTHSNNVLGLLKIGENPEYTKISVGVPIVNMELWPSADAALIQLATGEIIKYHTSDQFLLESLFSLATNCVQITPYPLPDKVLVFALDCHNRFYINDQCIANNITSFFAHCKFLLLTTSQHNLLCVKLDKNGINALKKDTSKLFTRRVERGSKIITVVQDDRKTILQLPRGNLETIYPRAMSIEIISTLIDAKRYNEAFKIMKTERINLNLLYDHAPDQFLQDIEHFIDDINDPVHLNMFMLELHTDDVTRTMYASCYSTPSTSNVADKVLRVTGSVVEALRARDDSDRFLLSIVTAYAVRRTQTDLECALNVIRETVELSRSGKKLAVTADAGLGHLLLLVPINEVYNIALGMYDFDLIMMVAAKSQKDPKEYIPFLNELHKMDDNYKNFTINTYLKRFPIALEFIAKCPEQFEECLSFVQTHQLYKEALAIFKDNNSEQFKQICEAFAKFLLEKRCYNESGIMFEKCGLLPKALNMYKLVLNWNRCIIVAAKMNYNAREFQSLGRNLVDELVMQRMYKDASVILNDHLNDHEEAIAILIQAKLWQEALRLIYTHNRLDLIETHLRPKVLQSTEDLTAEIKSSSEKFKHERERLQIVRTTQLQEFESETAVQHMPESDLYSDTASEVSHSNSTASNSSFRSFRSSKNRRKHERKLMSLKEGSAYEDIALIRSLHLLVTNTAALRSDVHALCLVLVSFDYTTQAKVLQTTLDSLMQEMKAAEHEIWTPDLWPQRSAIFGPSMTSNMATFSLQNDARQQEKYNTLEPHIRHPPDLPSIHWKLFMLS